MFLPVLIFFGGEALDVVLVEDGGHGLDGFEVGADLFELVAVEDLGGFGGVVEVAAEDVPAGEDDVVEVGDGGEVFDEGAAAFGALAEANVCPSGRESRWVWRGRGGLLLRRR